MILNEFKEKTTDIILFMITLLITYHCNIYKNAIIVLFEYGINIVEYYDYINRISQLSSNAREII